MNELTYETRLLSTAQMQTSLCHLLNIELPIIQAPIGSATCPALVAAVSNAGGLGMFAMSWRHTDEIQRMIRETHLLTDHPFGINLVLAWQQLERLEVCLKEGVKIISFSWGDPTPYVDIAHSAGAIVIQTVSSVAEAKQAIAAGVDIIVAQGWEAGGHVQGQVTTFSLLPKVVDTVHPTPVVAAGGIADGRGIVAALALGASGVWIGTRFLASVEAAVHRLYKEKLLQATESDTFYSCLFNIGWKDAPHRVIRNSTVIQWESADCPPIPQRPGEGEVVAEKADGTPIIRYSDVMPLPTMTGNLESLALYTGQSVGLVSQIQPAGEIVRQLAFEARSVSISLRIYEGSTPVETG
ncbi:NAD(P)H-dependent flavin oxidoreductase [Nostoc sp. C117]|uniref:NAD(P)H-dependent flavin oxidoreductase n=1 Tax=Nostoc sp. C117 TaxID=3349875 RepID=UPI00370D9793